MTEREPASLLGLLKGVLRGLQAPSLPEGQDDVHVSHCGCPLPEGCWGSHGWHFYRETLYTLDRRERIKFAAERPGWSVEELRRAYGAWWRELDMAGQLDNEDVPAIWRPYLGQVIAYEPCPAYRAKVAQGLEAETAKRAPTKKTYERKPAYFG
jgi:hypothetical protein